MTAPAKPPIYEQINSDIGLLRVEAAKYPHDDYRRNQLNGIANKLKRITEAAGRPEPEYFNAGKTAVTVDSYNDLLAAYDRVAAERDGWKTLSPCELMAGNAALMEYGKHWEGRAEAAERQLAMRTKTAEGLRSQLEEADTQLAERCDHCGAKVYSGPPDCPTCGAPICCPQCCRIDTLTRQLAEAEKREKD